MSYCYLILPPKGQKITKEWRQKTIDSLLPKINSDLITTDSFRIDGRITNHGFLKVIHNDFYFSKKYFEKWLKSRRFRFIEVKDKTKHWNADLWESPLWARSQVNGMSEKNRKKAFRIILHYLFNLFDINEVGHYCYWAKRYKKFYRSKKATPEVDHGWELDELRKAGLIK